MAQGRSQTGRSCGCRRRMRTYREMKVTMLNINEGHNRELMEQCHILREYSQYVARVRKYAARMELNEAVERAITECIRGR